MAANSTRVVGVTVRSRAVALAPLAVLAASTLACSSNEASSPRADTGDPVIEPVGDDGDATPGTAAPDRRDKAPATAAPDRREAPPPGPVHSARVKGVRISLVPRQGTRQLFTVAENNGTASVAISGFRFHLCQAEGERTCFEACSNDYGSEQLVVDGSTLGRRSGFTQVLAPGASSQDIPIAPELVAWCRQPEIRPDGRRALGRTAGQLSPGQYTIRVDLAFARGRQDPSDSSTYGFTPEERPVTLGTPRVNVVMGGAARHEDGWRFAGFATIPDALAAGKATRIVASGHVAPANPRRSRESSKIPVVEVALYVANEAGTEEGSPLGTTRFPAPAPSAGAGAPTAAMRFFDLEAEVTPDKSMSFFRLVLKGRDASGRAFYSAVRELKVLPDFSDGADPTRLDSSKVVACDGLGHIVGDQVLVSFKANTADSEIRRVADLAGKRSMHYRGLGDTWLIALRHGGCASIQKALVTLRREPSVSYAEPNSVSFLR